MLTALIITALAGTVALIFGPDHGETFDSTADLARWLKDH